MSVNRIAIHPPMTHHSAVGSDVRSCSKVSMRAWAGLVVKRSVRSRIQHGESVPAFSTRRGACGSVMKFMFEGGARKTWPLTLLSFSMFAVTRRQKSRH